MHDSGRWITLYVVLCFSLLPFALFSDGAKIIPGGPYLSVSGNIVVPLLLTIFVVLHYRRYSTLTNSQRLTLLFSHGLALLITCGSYFATWAFAIDPHARGRWFGP